MADLVNFSITDLPDITATVPRFRIECEVRDSQTGALLFDFTGAGALTFPGVLSTLTAQQRKSLLRGLVRRIVLMKAEIDDGAFSDT